MLETIINAIMPNILEIVLTILSLVVAKYVIPYIKNDFIPWLKEKHIYSVVNKFVKAVEKLAETGAINKVDKKKKVIELLEGKGIAVDATVEAFIESCVKELDAVTSVVCEEIIEAEGN
jgi:hypothetical protein